MQTTSARTPTPMSVLALAAVTAGLIAFEGSCCSHLPMRPT